MAGANDHNAFHDDLGPNDDSSLMSVRCSLICCRSAGGLLNGCGDGFV